MSTLNADAAELPYTYFMQHSRASSLRAFFYAVAITYISGTALIPAFEFANSLPHPRSKLVPDDVLGQTMQIDALNYLKIVHEGYQYSSENRSLVAFFPFYPLISWLVALFTGWREDICLLLVSNLFFCFTLAVLYMIEEDRQPLWTLCLLSVFPFCLFFRLAYTESLFSFFTALTLLGMKRRWPLWIIGLIAGAATGVRPVGVAVSVAVWWYALSLRSSSGTGKIGQLVRFTWLIPLSVWGILGYSIYLGWAFDSPLAFAQAQDHWRFLSPKEYTLSNKLFSLFTLEPIWNVYNPYSQRFWMNGDFQHNPLLSWLFWNPLVYIMSWFLIILGRRKGWLRGHEVVLSVGLLLIPYVTRAYEMSMASHARFASVVLPQYFVLGRLIAMLPPALAACLCGCMCLMLGIWTIMFVMGHLIF